MVSYSNDIEWYLYYTAAVQLEIARCHIGAGAGSCTCHIGAGDICHIAADGACHILAKTIADESWAAKSTKERS
jgi:hypothetical protein